MLVLFILAAMWIVVAGRWALRRRREGRPGSSVVSFRHQLSTLERATPGHSLRLSTNSGPAPLVRSMPPVMPMQTKRRRNILFGLGGTTVFFLLGALLRGGVLTVLFVFSAVTLGAYVFALVQMRKRAAERQAKVRVLRPRIASSSNPGLRDTASN